MKNNKKIPLALASVAVFASLAVFGYGLLHGNTKDNLQSSSAASNPSADINTDGQVNIQDLSILLTKWGTADTTADINKDGTVNISDLSILLSSWGAVTTTSNPGAKLPINYDLASITGTKIYVSPGGNDSTGNGTQLSPYKTVKKAVTSVSVSPTTILLSGGSYDLKSESSTYVEWGKTGYSITIKALPGQVPIFDGSKPAPLTAVVENGSGYGNANLKHFAYDTVAGGLGAGLGLGNLPVATFSGTTPTGLAAIEGFRCVSGSSYTSPSLTPTIPNPSGCATGSPFVVTAYYSDQAWYNGTRLVQVLDKNKVTPNTFYVDRNYSNDGSSFTSQLYVDQSLDLSKLSVSSNKHDIRVLRANTVIEGIKIIRNSPGPGTGNYCTMYLNSGASNSVIRDVIFDNNANNSLCASGDSGNGVDNLLIERVSAINSGWQGAGFVYTNNLVIKDSEFSDSNSDGEWAYAPASGGIKVGRLYKTKVLNNKFYHNNSSGMWFDQENYDTEVVGNQFIDNAKEAFFYEISHKLLFANNYVKANGGEAVRSAGSGDLKFVNNTIVGGGAGIAIYTDDRSKKYDSNSDGTPDRLCSENGNRYGGSWNSSCNGMSSDLNVLHPGLYGTVNDTPGMDWMPGLSLMMNNIFTDQHADTTAHSNCSYDALIFCIVSFHDTGPVLINPTTIIKQTAVVNGNVYQTNDPTKRFLYVRTDDKVPCKVDVMTLSALQTAFAAAGCYNMTVESNGKYSSAHGFADPIGNPTVGLNHSEAAAVPLDSVINQYIPAGTKHYGVTYK